MQKLYLPRVTSSLEILCCSCISSYNSKKYNLSHQVVQSQVLATQNQQKYMQHQHNIIIQGPVMLWLFFRQLFCKLFCLIIRSHSHSNNPRLSLLGLKPLCRGQLWWIDSTPLDSLHTLQSHSQRRFPWSACPQISHSTPGSHGDQYYDSWSWVPPGRYSRKEIPGFLTLTVYASIKILIFILWSSHPSLVLARVSGWLATLTILASLDYGPGPHALFYANGLHQTMSCCLGLSISPHPWHKL